MIKLLAVCIGAILVVSILIGQDATAVLSGTGRFGGHHHADFQG